jgi:hypothetical protein
MVLGHRQTLWIVLASCLAMEVGLSGCRGPAVRDPIIDPLAALELPGLDDLAAPSNFRNWAPDLAVMPYAERTGDHVTIHNIRNFRYQTDDDYVINYYDRTYDLRNVKSLDFVVVPFKDTPSLAHTMLSFGFSDGSYLGVSAEARLEAGEAYSPLQGLLRQYELMYVLADERDLIGRRTRHRHADVYVYPTVATAKQSRAIFVGVLERINELARQPEFYDTLWNNCTTNIVRHVNELRPGAVPSDARVLLPGFADQLAYDLGLLRTDLPFAQAKRSAHVNRLADRFLDAPDFSQRIRRL